MSDITDDNFEKLIAKLEDSPEDSSPKPSIEESLTEEESVKKTQKITESAEDKEQEIKSEDDLRETQVKTTDSDSDYPHISIITSEGIDVSQLPDEIKDMINYFNSKRVEALSSSSSESVLLKLKKLSVIISDRIMDWLEKDDAPVKKEQGGEVIDEKEVESKTELFGEDFLGGIFNW
jgi:hypothetical protein